MMVTEIKRGTNRVTGATMYLCEFADKTPCLMINGVNVKTGDKAIQLFDYLLKK